MEKFSKATAKILNQVNTIISANDWVACAVCLKNHRPSGIGGDGICRTCHDGARARNSRLGGILSVRAMAEHTRGRFEVTEENFDAFEAVRTFNPYKESLYLFGNCGVGKSHLASLIIRQAVNLGMWSIIHTEPSPMLRAINAALREGAESEERAINRFVNASLLVIDDLGTEKVTDYKLEKLYEVINGRDKALRHGLVITSNYSIQQIAERLNDDRIASRLSGLCDVIRVGGQDWRLAK